MDGLWNVLVWDLIDFVLDLLVDALAGIFGDRP